MDDGNTSLAPLGGPHAEQTADEGYRIAPHNIEAEQALLGAILVSNDAYDRVSGFLEPLHFFDPLHGRIYEAATKLIVGGHLASPVTLKSFFERDNLLDDIGGTAYLALLAKEATTVTNAYDYGRTIYDLSRRRDLIRIGEELAQTAYDSPVDLSPSQQIEAAEQSLYSVAETGKYGGGFQGFQDSLTSAIDMAANAYKRDGGLSGISTGLTDLDAKLGGLQATDLLIVAGRPGMGKSSLATNIAFNAARAYRTETSPNGEQEVVDGAVVGFFSLEMSAEQLATRLLSEVTGVSSEKVRRGQITEDDFERLVGAMQELQQLPLYIDDTGGLAFPQLAARARRLKRQHGLGLLVVDYVQLLSGSGKAKDNRVQELTEITTGLKALAKELEVPIIACAQLSRAVEQRDDKRPLLSDLRESGSIEQDADAVMFVYREEYYLNMKMPPEDDIAKTEEWRDQMGKVHNKADVIIAKQRHGPTGTVPLVFEAEITRFSNLERTHQPPY